MLSNAIKFSNKGQITVQTDIIGKRKKTTLVEFTVTDHGTGIPKDQINSVFEKYVQADMSVTKSYPGAGLGLSIIKKLTENLGGYINVESEVGQGSKFSVTLPFYEV